MKDRQHVKMWDINRIGEDSEDGNEIYLVMAHIHNPTSVESIRGTAPSHSPSRHQKIRSCLNDGSEVVWKGTEDSCIFILGSIIEVRSRESQVRPEILDLRRITRQEGKVEPVGDELKPL